MRRLFVGLVVAAATALAPFASMADNQQVAQQIAAGLEQSGKLHGYKIGVKYQDGTAWLRGSVSSQEQLDAAMKLARQQPGVSRVVNELTIAGSEEKAGPKNILTQFLTAPANDSALQQAEGATAGEQVGRPMSGNIASADRLASSFGPATVQPVTAETSTSAARTQPMALAYMQPTPAESPSMPIPEGAMVPAQTAAPGYAPGMVIGPNGQPCPPGGYQGGPIPQYMAPGAGAPVPSYDQAYMPNYAWPGYAAYPNYAAVTYPKQYSPTAWPYIDPFYPYPQVPLGWRKVSLEWHDGWWHLDFDDGPRSKGIRGILRPCD